MHFFYVKVNYIRYIIRKGRAVMTIVESFERAPLNNILSALESHAEKIIFLGDPAHMQKHMIVYKKLLKMKGISTELVLKDVSGLCLDDILELLTKIVESEDSIIFDITGGSDLVLLAFGIIYERYRSSKNIKLQHFDIPTEDYPLNVKEIISLYGGIVIPEEPQPTVSNAMEVVDKIWDFARGNSSKWNRTNSFLKELEKKGNQSEEDLSFHLDFSKNKHRIENYILKRQIFLDGLDKIGLKHTIPQGSYFVMVDISDFQKPGMRFHEKSDMEFCEWMIRTVGVAAVPGSSFFREPVNHLIRLHFARSEETLYEALSRLAKIPELLK